MLITQHGRLPNNGIATLQDATLLFWRGWSATMTKQAVLLECIYNLDVETLRWLQLQKAVDLLKIINELTVKKDFNLDHGIGAYKIDLEIEYIKILLEVP
jgi:hypothetical protein